MGSENRKQLNQATCRSNWSLKNPGPHSWCSTFRLCNFQQLSDDSLLFNFFFFLEKKKNHWRWLAYDFSCPKYSQFGIKMVLVLTLLGHILLHIIFFSNHRTLKKELLLSSSMLMFYAIICDSIWRIYKHTKKKWIEVKGKQERIAQANCVG